MMNLRREHVGRLGTLGMRCLGVIAVSYIVASMTSTFLMSGMLKTAISAFGRKPSKPAITASLSFGPGENYRDLIKAVKDRNIFNSGGEFPEEKNPDASDGGEKKSASTFDLNAPCQKPKAAVELVGTIVMGEGSSIATIQEQGYSEADIYREGDFVIGSDTAQIVKIERNRVIINNGGVKECLELAATKEKKDGGAFPDAAPTKPPVGGAVAKTDGETPAAAGNDCSLEEKYLQDELGPGFGTIIQKARLVPNTTDNVMNGFKIFAIDASSLIAKIGLKNGDIITQVNDTSLKQPEQGFALYQAFQDEREVRVHILRGNAPLMITCRIK